MGSRPTIQMVAELAGVSRGTVDRVLNDRPHVNEEVRRRVLEAMRRDVRDMAVICEKYYQPGYRICEKYSIT